VQEATSRSVVVLGAGALGSVYAAWLAEAGHDVTIVARTAHAEAVAAGGLRLRTLDGGQRTVAMGAVDNAGDAPDADMVLVAAKSFDVAGLLSDYTGSPSLAFSIQNGVAQSDPLVERFGEAAVGCVSMVGGTLEEPGVASHTFAGSTYLGDLDTTHPGAAAEIASFLPSETEVRDDIVDVLWSKGVLAAAAMGVSGLTRMEYFRMLLTTETCDAFLDVTLDGAAIAAADGISMVDLPGPLQAGSLMRLSREDARARLASVGQQIIDAGQTGMKVSALQSIERRRPLEIDAVYNDLLAVADRHALPVPALRTVARLMTGVDTQIRAEIGRER
jgi:2-dehydropantoate 2-reductase